MTHPTEELRRQYEAAKSREGQAATATREARDRYHAALCADKLAEFEAMGGVIGKTRVRASKWDGKLNMIGGPFLVVGAFVVYGICFYRLAKIKKDGTPSAAPSGADCETVLILEEDQ